MRDTGDIHPFKRLLIDVFMALVFLLLLSAAAWTLWVFYVRGPVQIEPRGFLSSTAPGESVRPQDVDRYTLRHFHNLDEVSIAGIQYDSVCISCHGDYPHSKSPKVRAFFNAHAWFIDCDVCHLQPLDTSRIEYRWFSHVDNNELKELKMIGGVAGNYGGRIARVRIENGITNRIRDPGAEAFMQRYLRTKSDLDEAQKTAAETRIHNSLADKPLFCDDCHAQKGRLDFDKLLYSSHDAKALRAINVAAMVTTYQEFHLPALFDY